MCVCVCVCMNEKLRNDARRNVDIQPAKTCGLRVGLDVAEDRYSVLHDQ